MDINVKDINMRYYQPEFDDLPITILYDEENMKQIEIKFKII